MKNALVLSVLSGIALAAGAPAFQTATPRELAPCPNPFPHEPLVVYEVTGWTLGGPVDQLLVVSDDGSARLSSSLGGDGSSESVVVGSAAAELQEALVAAGALVLCEEPDFTSDMPLSTLTVLRKAPRGRPNTLSWFVPQNAELAAIEALLQAFIAEHFGLSFGGGD